MRRAFLLGVVSAIGLAFGLSPAYSSQTPSNELVIDGAKNPEKFPEWYVWQFFFEALSVQPQSTVVGGTQIAPLHTRLGVSEPELALLQAEAKRFRDSEQQLQRQVQQKKEAMREKSGNEFAEAARPLEMEHRHRILETRARIYEGLSPASLQSLRQWINHGLRGNTVHLRGSAIKYFQLPW